MTGLTETEYRTLRTRTLAILGELGAADNATATAIAAHLVPTVEAILRERVADALNESIRRIEREERESFDGLIGPGEAVEIVKSVRDGVPLRVSDGVA